MITQTFALGTMIQINIFDGKIDEAQQETIDRINELENSMSYFKEESEIAQINQKAGLDRQKVSDAVYFVIKKAVQYSAMSEGAIDLTVRPIVNLWRVGEENAQPPDRKCIEKTLQLVNYKDIVIDDEVKTVGLNKKGQEIDLNCIAKGFAADEIRNIMQRHDVSSALINLGGNIYAYGSKPDGSPWKIGVQNPFKERGYYAGYLNVKNKSVVTSGDYEKFHMYNGRKIHHIFNPKTGYPVNNDIVSTTIISDKSIDGDALTTCLYVMGVVDGLELVGSLPHIDAVIITKDRKVYGTPNMRDRFILTNSDFCWAIM